jgi:hypothetical protein
MKYRNMLLKLPFYFLEGTAAYHQEPVRIYSFLADIQTSGSQARSRNAKPLMYKCFTMDGRIVDICMTYLQFISADAFMKFRAGHLMQTVCERSRGDLEVLNVQGI